MKILYCILHTKNQKSRVDNIIKTWGKNNDLIFFSDHEDSELNIHKVSENSSYNSGQEKQIKSIQFLIDNKNEYDWYVFCDNDTFINTKLIEVIIKDFNEDAVYGEIINCWAEDRTLFYPSGGAGFVVSRKTLLKLSGKVKQNNVIWGDVSVGINLRNNKINTIDMSNVFHSQKPSFYKIPDKDIKNHASFHYIKDLNQMQTINKLCES
jgi:hypothetical protein